MTRVYCPECESCHEIPDKQADAAGLRESDTVKCDNCTGGLIDVLKA